MYKFLFAILIISISACNTLDCEQIKSGEFAYDPEIGSDTKIIRTLKEQTESSKSNGFVDVYSIFWTKECSYHLVPKSTNKPFERLQSEKDTLWVKVNNFETDHYTFTASLKKETFNGKLYKLNK